MVKEIDLTKTVVYLAAPKRLLSSDLYDRAFRFLLARCAGVMNPQWMFQGNDDWLKNYEKALEPCNVMVVVSDDNFVGKGVYLEYEYFRSRFCACYYYIEDEFLSDSMDFEVTQELVPIVRLEIDDSENWKDYAVVKY